MKKMKSFKLKRKANKFADQGNLFIHDLGMVLDEYDPEQHMYDLELLITVLSIAEKFFSVPFQSRSVPM